MRLKLMRKLSNDRDMLNGSSRAIYEGPFGLQPQVFRLKEYLLYHSARGMPASVEKTALNAWFPKEWSWAENIVLSGALMGEAIEPEVLMGEPGWTVVGEREEAKLREERRQDGLELVVLGTVRPLFFVFPLC